MRAVPDFTKLLSLEEYVALSHEVPYVYTCEPEDRKLTVFGADHSNDPEHPQFQQLEAIFETEEPHCVLIEGLQDEVVFTRLSSLLKNLHGEVAIQQGGESVYAAALALATGYTWGSVEPSDSALFSYLESLGFSRQNIVVWYALRLLPQYVRREETIHFNEYITPFLEQLARATGWSEAQQDSQKVLEEATQLLQRDLVLHSEAQALRYVSAVATLAHDQDYTVMNTISAVANEFRDRAMVQAIHTALCDYSSVLVVYGASHAVVQEPVLRAMCSE